MHVRTFGNMKKNKIIDVNGSNKPKSEIPMSIIISFTSALFIFGFDFGFSKVLKKNVQLFATGVRLFIAFSFITAISIQIVYKLENEHLTATSWLIYGLIQYSLHVFFLHFSNYNLYNLLVDMYSVGTYTKVKRNELNAMVFFLITIFWISYTIRGIFCYFMCTIEIDECKTVYVPGYLFCDIIIGMDVVTLAQILIYYYIYKTAKYLNAALEDKDVKWAREQFSAIADICDKIAPIYGRLVSILCLSCFFFFFLSVCAFLEIG